MKVTANIKVFYKGTIYKPGDKVDIKGNIAPSWAKEYKPVKEEKQVKAVETNKTPEESNSDETSTDKYANKTPEELENILDDLINKSIEKDITIEDADKKSVIEQIMELEKKLAEVQE